MKPLNWLLSLKNYLNVIHCFTKEKNFSKGYYQGMVYLEIFINCMLYSAIYHSDKIAMATDIPYKMKSCYLLSECRRQSTFRYFYTGIFTQVFLSWIVQRFARKSVSERRRPEQIRWTNTPTTNGPLSISSWTRVHSQKGIDPSRSQTWKRPHLGGSKRKSSANEMGRFWTK